MGDRVAVAGMVEYPLDVFRVGMPSLKQPRPELTVSGPKEFSANYDRIMTKEVRRAVERADDSNLLAKSDGIMLPDGQIWLADLCVRGQSQDSRGVPSCEEFGMRIVAINHTDPALPRALAPSSSGPVPKADLAREKQGGSR
jgi:hypothetical protein